MFGTLSISLGSEYEGGQLVVRHAGREMVLEPKDRVFSVFWAAFYADCEHELLPVTQGYRIALVFNIVHVGSQPAPKPSNSKIYDELVQNFRFWKKLAGPDEAVVRALACPISCFSF
jgi:predicted 2-oxoglutarate/Fe(II)-dependent dioxygenase YbiX